MKTNYFCVLGRLDVQLFNSKLHYNFESKNCFLFIYLNMNLIGDYEQHVYF